VNEPIGSRPAPLWRRPDPGDTAQRQRHVYLVVTDVSGLVGTYLDEAEARRMAAGIASTGPVVLAAVPIIADYRTPGQEA